MMTIIGAKISKDFITLIPIFVFATKIARRACYGRIELRKGVEIIIQFQIILVLDLIKVESN